MTRPHGIAGAVKVALHWAESRALARGVRVHLVLASGERELEIQALQGAGKQLIVTFAGVDTRNAAEELQGARLTIERALLPPLGEGEYYLVDLIGARVVGPDGPLGEVLEVRTHPSVDTVLIRAADGACFEQALSPPWLRRVDAASKLIELESTDGLMPE